MLKKVITTNNYKKCKKEKHPEDVPHAGLLPFFKSFSPELAYTLMSAIDSKIRESMRGPSPDSVIYDINSENVASFNQGEINLDELWG